MQIVRNYCARRVRIVKISSSGPNIVNNFLFRVYLSVPGNDPDRPSWSTILTKANGGNYVVWTAMMAKMAGRSIVDRTRTSLYPVSPGWRRWRRRQRRRRRKWILAVPRDVRERRGAEQRESARFRSSGAAQRSDGPGRGLVSLFCPRLLYILAATAVAAFVVSHASGAAGVKRGAAA